MPAYGMQQKSQSEILTFEEIVAIVRIAASLGINKVKITGGEPLMRRDLPGLFVLLSSVVGLQDISLTTNGVFLERYVEALKVAGLKRINISIDTLNHRKFERICQQDFLEHVLKGIDAALEEGFSVKLNVIVLRGMNDDEVLDFVQFAQEKNVTLRFIELMPMGQGCRASQDLFVSCDEIKENLELLGALSPVNPSLGNGPAQYYEIEGTSLIVGFISPISCKFCFACNRLRLTADGLLIPCLTSKVSLDLKKPLREKKEEDVLDLIKKAIFLKPEGHDFTCPSQRQYIMSQIGG
jgi:cyclic pyranopterin phosphate synthase